MNTKHLKARILDLALQGKLVENSRIPNDVKSRIPSDFNPPFEIPNSWQWVKLGDICDTITTKNTLQQKFIHKTGKFPVITQGSNFIEGYFDDENLAINHEKEALVIFGDHTKKVKFIDFPFILGADGTKILKPKENINSKFFYFLIIFASQNTRNRGYSRHFQFIKKFFFPLPPKDEQEYIVNKIDELFGQIDILDTSKQNLLKNIKHTKARILELALQGKLVENSRIPNDLKSRIPSDFNPPFEIPNSWQWVKLEEVCNGSSAKLTLKELKQSGKFKVFGATGLVGYLDTFDKENSCIAIIKDGAGVGRVQILPPKSSALATMQYIENKENIIKLEFLARILIWLNLGKTFNGSAIPHIYFRNYKNFYIPLPPLDEQEIIVKKIDELFELLELIESSL